MATWDQHEIPNISDGVAKKTPLVHGNHYEPLSVVLLWNVSLSCIATSSRDRFKSNILVFNAHPYATVKPNALIYPNKEGIYDK